MRRAGLLLLLGTITARQGLAQAAGPVSLEGRLAPAVAAQVQSLADSLSRAGLPGQPVLRKALEGSAKGVAADRIVAAARTVAEQLDRSAAALRQAGVGSDSGTVEAGAYAINAGLEDREVAQVARASHPPYQPAASLRSAGTLVAMGVPAPQAVSLVREWIAAGRSPRDVGSLPSQVQAAMSPGLTAAQAARGMSRGQGQGHAPPGPPPHPGNQGTPPNRPDKGKPPHRP